MNQLGILIDIAHASAAAARQIIDESHAPVVHSHTSMAAVCCGGMSDDLLKALAAKDGLVGIHGAAQVIGKRYNKWARGHKAAPSPLFPILRYAPPFPRAPIDHGEYSDRFDAAMRELWKANGEPWHDTPEAGALVPDVDEWAQHVRNVVDTVGAAHVGIGLDLVPGRSGMRDFNAASYPRLVSELKRNFGDRDVEGIAGENWLRVWGQVESVASPQTR
jgi:membrane dipeptidase